MVTVTPYDSAMGEVEGHLEAIFEGVKGAGWTIMNARLPLVEIGRLAQTTEGLASVVRDRFSELLANPDLPPAAKHAIEQEMATVFAPT